MASLRLGIGRWLTAALLLALPGTALAQGSMGRAFGNLRSGDCAAISRFANTYAGREGYSNYGGRIETLRRACQRPTLSQSQPLRTPAARPTATATRRPTVAPPTPPRRTAARTTPTRVAVARPPAPRPRATPPRPRPQQQAQARPRPPAPPRPQPVQVAARPEITLPQPYTARNPFLTMTPPPEEPVLAEATPPAPVAIEPVAETPMPTDAVRPAWLSSAELLTYMRTNLLCYDYDARRNECAEVEELEDESGGAVSLRRTYLVDVSNEGGYGALIDDLGFHPRTARFEASVSLYTTGPDFCWGRETAGQDARRLQISVTDADPYQGNVALRGAVLEEARDIVARSATRLGAVTCRRYRWLEPGRSLQEELVVGDRIEPGDTVRLIARTSRSVRLALLASIPGE